MKHYKTRLNGHIIESAFYGRWDIQIMNDFLSDVKMMLIPLQGQTLGSVTDLRKWEGSDEQAFAKIKAELNRLVAAGSSRAAYVVDVNSLQMDILNQSSPKLSGYIRKLFTNKHDAIQWLREQGFVMPLDDQTFCKL